MLKVNLLFSIFITIAFLSGKAFADDEDGKSKGSASINKLTETLKKQDPKGNEGGHGGNAITRFLVKAKEDIVPDMIRKVSATNKEFKKRPHKIVDKYSRFIGTGEETLEKISLDMTNERLYDPSTRSESWIETQTYPGAKIKFGPNLDNYKKYVRGEPEQDTVTAYFLHEIGHQYGLNEVDAWSFSDALLAGYKNTATLENMDVSKGTLTHADCKLYIQGTQYFYTMNQISSETYDWNDVNSKGLIRSIFAKRGYDLQKWIPDQEKPESSLVAQMNIASEIDQKFEGGIIHPVNEVWSQSMVYVHIFLDQHISAEPKGYKEITMVETDENFQQGDSESIQQALFYGSIEQAVNRLPKCQVQE